MVVELLLTRQRDGRQRQWLLLQRWHGSTEERCSIVRSIVVKYIVQIHVRVEHKLGEQGILRWDLSRGDAAGPFQRVVVCDQMELLVLLSSEREALLDKSIGLDVAQVVVLLVCEEVALDFRGQPALSIGPALHTAFGFVPGEHRAGINLFALRVIEPSLDFWEKVKTSSFKYKKGILKCEDQSMVRFMAQVGGEL